MKDTMQNTDCSNLENSNTDFDQLSIVIRNVQEYLNVLRGNQEHIRVYSFEIPYKLITSLENLNELFLALAQETRLTDAQKKLLTTCERALARFYCWIHFCMETYLDRCKTELDVDESQQARRMSYEFYFYAMYELRNPYYLLKGHSEAQIFESESENWRDYLSQIYAPPLVPENQDTIEKINYWIEELGKFMDDLPRLRQEVEDAA